MEPQVVNSPTGGPPLVGWSQPSASMASVLDSPLHSSGIASDSEDETQTEELSTFVAPEKNNNNGHVVNCEVKFDVPSKEDDSLVTGSASSVYEEEEDDEEEDRRHIPDGGWGWVVVFSSLVISLIADGISYSFGLIYIEFLRYFQESKSVTSWIGSLFLAVPLLSGPVCSALVDKFGCRSMTILGALISCVGFVMSAYANNIVVMYITFGVISGIGLGLCYVTAVVSIAYWFDKKRSLANGLGGCGSGLGTFLYAPFTKYLIYEYGWRGAMLILGGTLLHMAVCGALMREPEWFIKENRGSSVATKSRASSRASMSDADFPGVEEIRKMIQSGTTPQYILTYIDSSINRKPSFPNGEASHNFQSVINLPTFVRRNEKVPVEVMEALKNNQPLYNVILENYPGLTMSRSVSDHGALNESPARSPLGTRSPKGTVWRRRDTGPTPSSPLLASPVLDKVIAGSMESPVPHARKAGSTESPVPHARKTKHFQKNPPLQGYLKNIRVRRNSVVYRGAMLNIRKYRLKASSCPDIFRNSMTTLAKENEQSWRKELLELFRDMADFSMFLDFHFLLISISTTLVYTYYIVPYFYLAEFMISEGYTVSDGSTALSVIGITTMFGMVFLGWMGDQPWVSISKSFSFCLIMTALFTIAIPIFMYDYWSLMVVSAGFGLFYSSVYSFTPPLLVEIIHLDRFTNAYGLSLLCQGIGNLLGPPIAGWIFDETQTWHLSFHLAGVGLIVSAIIIAIIPYTNNRILCSSPNKASNQHLSHNHTLA